MNNDTTELYYPYMVLREVVDLIHIPITGANKHGYNCIDSYIKLRDENGNVSCHKLPTMFNSNILYISIGCTVNALFTDTGNLMRVIPVSEVAGGSRVPLEPIRCPYCASDLEVLTDISDGYSEYPTIHRVCMSRRCMAFLDTDILWMLSCILQTVIRCDNPLAITVRTMIQHGKISSCSDFLESILYNPSKLVVVPQVYEYIVNELSPSLMSRVQSLRGSYGYNTCVFVGQMLRVNMFLHGDAQDALSGISSDLDSVLVDESRFFNNLILLSSKYKCGGDKIVEQLLVNNLLSFLSCDNNLYEYVSCCRVLNR